MGLRVAINGKQEIVADLTPPGVVASFGGGSVPDGWLLCDGTSYLRTSYSPLFAIIGTSFGAADGTHFNVPDLRGRFLRGLDGSAGVDPDKTSRTALKPGGNTGNNIGSVQNSATKRPTAPFTTPATNTGIESSDHTHSVSPIGGSPGSSAYGNIYGSSANQRATSGRSTAHIHTVPSMSVTAGGDPETRPANIYVNFIIKI